MDTKSVLSLVEQLQDDIEDLEENLEPLLAGALATTTKRLPLLDRAKLNAILVYSIESLLFSYLRLNGVSAKDHAVFRELTRVKQYFEKIQQAQNAGLKSQPARQLDKGAADRFIKHALAGNEKYDLELAERKARDRVLANLKLKTLENSMKEKAEAQTQEQDAADVHAALQQAAQQASVPQPESSDDSSTSGSDSDDDEEGVLGSPETHEPISAPVPSKTPAHDQNQQEESSSKPPNSDEPPPKTSKGKKRKDPPVQEQKQLKKKQKKAEKKARKKAHTLAKQESRKPKKPSKKAAKKAKASATATAG